MSLFSDLRIDRIAVHEVFKRDEDLQPVAPKCSDALLNLDEEGLGALRDRITKAMGSDSKSVEMTVTEDGPASTFQLCAGLIDADDATFLEISQLITQKLAGAQTARTIPGGVVVVLNGLMGREPKPFSAVIKAEIQSGFQKQSAPTGTLLTYLKDLLLTKNQRLHKIAVFIRLGEPTEDGEPMPDDFGVYVFDALMSGSEITTAANYFYERFLGCTAASTSRKRTRDFYTQAKTFLQTANVQDEKKVEMVTGLHAYLRSNRQLIQATEFAAEFLPEELQQSFVDFLEENDVPPIAIQKDLTAIRSKLRIRKVTFTGDVNISAPAERFRELVDVGAYEDGVTVVRIHGRVASQA